MNSTERTFVQECINSLTKSVNMNNDNWNTFKNVMSMIMPGFDVPLLESFNSNKESISAMNALAYIKSECSCIETFPLILEFRKNISPSDEPKYYLLYEITTKNWYIAKTNPDTNKLVNYYKLDSKFDNELYADAISPEKEKMIIVIGEISAEQFMKRCINDFYPSSIPQKNKLVHIINATQNKELFGIVENVKYIKEKDTFEFKFLYMSVNENELINATYTLQEDDWIVCDIEKDYIPDGIINRMKSFGINIQNGKYKGIDFISKRFNENLIAIPDSNERGIIVGICNINNDIPTVSYPILITYSKNVEFLSFPVTILQLTLHWEPNETQQNLWKQYRMSITRDASAAGISHEVIDNSVKEHEYVTSDEFGTMRVTKITEETVTLTNFQKNIEISLEKFHTLRKATQIEITNMLTNAFISMVHASLRNNFILKYYSDKDIFYINIHLNDTGYLKIPVYEDGEWYAEVTYNTFYVKR